MNSSLSMARTLAAPAAAIRRVRLLSLVPVLVVVIIFKMAISDGGRHLATLSFAQIAVLLLAAAVLWSGTARPLAALPPLLATTVVIGASFLWSIRQESTLRELLLWSSYACIFVLTAWTLAGLRAARWFLDAAVVTAGWLSLIALYVFWGAGSPAMRWQSTFYWPNPFAAFLLLLLPLEVVRCTHARGTRDSLSHGAVALMLAVPFLLTYSRGAWLSLAAVVPLACFVLRPPSWTAALRRIAVVALLSVILALLLTRGARLGTSSPLILDRATSISDASDLSVQGRLHFWRAGLGIVRDHPVAGTGAGTYAYVHPQYQADVRFYSRSAHNLYLQVVAEVGLVGAIPFFVFAASLVALWFRCLRKAHGTEAYPLVAGVGLGLAAFAAHSALDMNWDFPAIPAMAFALAGVLAWYDAGTGPQVQAIRGGTRSSFVAGRSLATVVLVLMAAAVGVRYAAEQHFLEGRRHAVQARWSAAAAELRVAARLNPLNANYVSGWGEAVQRLTPGSEDVLSAMRRGMRLDPRHAYYPVQLAWTLIEYGHGTAARDEAQRLLQRALGLDPYHYPEAYRMLAQLYAEKGDYAAAGRLYEDAKSRYLGHGMTEDGILNAVLWPRVARLFLDRARELEALARPDEAIDLLRAVLKEDQFLVPAYLQLADLHLRQGERRAARAILESGLQKIPKSEEILVRLTSLKVNRIVPR